MNQASFLEFAPAYFEHMAHAAATNTPTTLAKIAGVYSISFKQQAAAGTGQVSLGMLVVVSILAATYNAAPTCQGCFSHATTLLVLGHCTVCRGMQTHSSTANRHATLRHDVLSLLLSCLAVPGRWQCGWLVQGWLH